MSTSVKDVCSDFAQSTSCHGLGQLTDTKKGFLTRCLWLLAILVMNGVYFYLLISTLMDYFSYPTRTSVQYKSNNSFLFPSITLCNNNYARRSAILNSKEAMFIFSPSDTSLTGEASAPININNIDIQQISMELSHQPADMFLQCGFDGQYQTPCSVASNFTWIFTAKALCYTYNSAEIIVQNGPKIATRPGNSYGLKLVVNVEEYDYAHSTSYATGLQVLVHDPDEIPDVPEMGFAVETGTETLVSIKKTLMKRLPEPYSEPPNLCENTKMAGFTNPLKYFSKYSVSACRQECRINHQLAVCNCSGHIYGGTNVKVCSYTDFHGCSIKARVMYQEDPSIEAACDCKPSCEETLYDVSVSSAAITNEYNKKELVAGLGVPQLTVNNFEKNVLVLKVFFGEMRYTEIEQVKVYTSASLFGELGGQMGLCLGASFLTIAELLQFAGTLFRTMLRRNSSSTSKVSHIKEQSNV